MATTEREIFTSFTRIIEEVGGVPASMVTPGADIAEDLEINSLAMVEMFIAAEEKFNVEIPDDAIKDLKTVQDVVSYVQRAQDGSSAPEEATT
jgi:acyl carrier protein